MQVGDVKENEGDELLHLILSLTFWAVSSYRKSFSIEVVQVPVMELISLGEPAGANALCFFAENCASEMVSKSFSTILLSLLPRLCEDTLGAEMGDEIVVQSSVELVKQYARFTVARDLEEVQTVMRLVKRVAAKSQLWRVVEALTVPSVQVHSRNTLKTSIVYKYS